MRIAYYVHGRGRGHASRARVLVPALREDGHEVHLLGGGDADDLLADFEGYQTIVPVTPGLRNTLKIPGRLRDDRKRLVHLSPDLVISDGDGPSLGVARSLGIETVVVGHDLVFARCDLPDGLPRWAVRAQKRSAFFATHLGKYGVAVNFLPVTAQHDNTVVARPSLRTGLEQDPTRTGRLVCYFRDRNGRDVVRWAAQSKFDVVAFGDDTLDVPGVDCRGFDRDGFDDALLSCSGIICSAGSNLLAEAVLLGKPVMAVYRGDDSEQCLNAMMIDRAGAGSGMRLDAITAKDVGGFLDGVVSGRFDAIDLAGQLPDTTTALRGTIARFG